MSSNNTIETISDNHVFTIGEKLTVRDNEGNIRDGVIIGAFIKLDKPIYYDWLGGGSISENVVLLSSTSKHVSGVTNVKKLKKD